MSLAEADEDLQRLEVGELCPSGWLILACTILHRHVSICNRSESLQTMAQLRIKAYFPSRIDIKKNAIISDSSYNYFNMIKRITIFKYSRHSSYVECNDFSIRSLRSFDKFSIQI